MHCIEMTLLVIEKKESRNVYNLRYTLLHNNEALCSASCFQVDFQVYVVIVLRILLIFNDRALCLLLRYFFLLIKIHLS